jgi:hypothetical protein
MNKNYYWIKQLLILILYISVIVMALCWYDWKLLVILIVILTANNIEQKKE